MSIWGKCWKSNVQTAREIHGSDSREHLAALDRPASCLLSEGHAGPHEFTFDGDICLIARRHWGLDIMKDGRKVGEIEHG